MTIFSKMQEAYKDKDCIEEQANFIKIIATS